MRIVSGSAVVSSESQRQELLTQDRQLRTGRVAAAAVPAGVQVSVSQQASYEVARQQQVSLQTASTVTQDASVVHQALTSVVSEATRFAVSGEAAVTMMAALGQREGPAISGMAQLQFSSYVYRQADEQVRLSLQGSLTDADGREIHFNVYLEQQQQIQWRQAESLSVDARPLTDPLVINFEADVVRLSDLAFEFDLDADGDLDTLSAPVAGSGFLVFDRNHDGLINDGSEMFGPSTGHGYSELALEDQDGNGWIDESDPIFSQLRVMVMAPEGPQLKSLHDLGVGAIGLQSGDTPISLTSNSGLLLGEVKRTGVVLMENGAVRTLQEIDLADLKAFEVPESDPWRDGDVLSRGARLQQGSAQQAGAEVAEDAFVTMVRDALAKLAEIRAQMEEQGSGTDDLRPTLLEQLVKAMNKELAQLQQQQKGARSYLTMQASS